MPKILFLGGTQFFGNLIVSSLISKGYEVGVLTRGRQKPILPFTPRWSFVGDRRDRSVLEKIHREGAWDVIIDNISYQASDVLDTLKTFKNLRQYILTSTISVYRYRNPSWVFPFHEDDPLDLENAPYEEPSNPHWQYARGKLEAELALKNQDFCPWTVFRPTIVYGPHDPLSRGSWYLARLMEGGPLILPNGGLNAFQLISSKDMPPIYESALLNSQCYGKTYNLAPEETFTLRKFVEWHESLLTMRGKPRPARFVSLPENELLPYGDLMHTAGPFAMADHWLISPKRLFEDLSISMTPGAALIEETLSWFLSQSPTWRASLLHSRKKELEICEKAEQF